MRCSQPPALMTSKAPAGARSVISAMNVVNVRAVKHARKASSKRCNDFGRLGIDTSR